MSYAKDQRQLVIRDMRERLEHEAREDEDLDGLLEYMAEAQMESMLLGE